MTAFLAMQSLVPGHPGAQPGERPPEQVCLGEGHPGILTGREEGKCEMQAAGCGICSPGRFWGPSHTAVSFRAESQSVHTHFPQHMCVQEAESPRHAASAQMLQSRKNRGRERVCTHTLTMLHEVSCPRRYTTHTHGPNGCSEG